VSPCGRIEALWFFSTRFTEVSQWIYRRRVQHSAQFGKCFVWREICIDNHFDHSVCFFYCFEIRQNAHSAYQRIYFHKIRYFRLAVPKRIRVEPGCLSNKIFVERLSPGLFLDQSFGGRLAALRKPSSGKRGDSSYHRSRRAQKAGIYSGITTLCCRFYRSGSTRGRSGIRRELRCPVK
jgi:hypothetical protein